MGANTSNYMEQGGARTVIGGSLDIVSGGDLDIESGGAIKIAGTDVTAEVAALSNGAGATSATAAATAYAGGGQGSATAITTAYTRFATVATNGDSGKLPTGALGKRITVKNDGAANLAIFPASGGAINGGSADASVTLYPGEEVTFTATSATAWETPETDAKLKGDQTLSGIQTFSVPNVYSLATGITAGTTQTQGGATALTKEYNDVTTVTTAGDGVKLMAAVAGQRQTVRNSASNALAVYPATGDAINTLSANASITLQAGEEVEFTAIDGTTWRTNVDDEIVTMTTSATPASGSNGVQFVFKNRHGVAIASKRAMTMWISDVNGAPVAAGTSVAALTNGSVDTLVTGKIANVITSAAGLLGVTLTAEAATYYLSFGLPNGRILTSSALVVN